jgi:hypothetical protein
MVSLERSCTVRGWPVRQIVTELRKVSQQRQAKDLNCTPEERMGK